MYDPMKLTVLEMHGSLEEFEVVPSVVIPATVARIKEWLAANQNFVAESNISVVTLEQIRGMPAKAWDDCLKSKADVEAADPLMAIPAITQRAFALQLAWSWFKGALSKSHGKGIVMHIAADENYRE